MEELDTELEAGLAARATALDTLSHPSTSFCVDLHNVLEQDPSIPLIISGGATGADLLWSTHAIEMGMHVCVCSFSNHKRSLPIATTNVHVWEIQDEELRSKAHFLRFAAAHLGRKLHLEASLSYVQRLLLRNAWIVTFAKSVIAVGHLEKDRVNKASTGVAGGTAWGCQMFLIALCASYASSTQRCGSVHNAPLYFYCMDSKEWFFARVTCSARGELQKVEWRPVDVASISIEFPCAAIGSRECSSETSEEMRRLLQRVFS